MGGASPPPCLYLTGGNMKTYTDIELKKHPFLNNGLFDPVQERIKTVNYVNKIYGAEVLDQLTAETYDARDYRRLYPEEAFSPALVEKMKSIFLKTFPSCGGIVSENLREEEKLSQFQSTIGFYTPTEPIPVKKNNKLQKHREKGDDFFMMLERGLFRNPEFRKIFKGPFTVYGWLWSNIVRKGWKDKKGYPIKERYYDRGLLAYCSSYSKIGKDCFMDKDTAKKYIDNFASNGIIKIDHIIPEGKKNPQSVFILGEWGEGPIERLYLVQVFLSEKKDPFNDAELWAA
jgi:hypothetical protein